MSPPLRRVQVAVDLPVYETYTYAVPAGLELGLGHAVLVPFGARGVSGFVLGPGDPELPDARLKAVRRLLDPEPAFDPDQLAFFRWTASYYLAPLGEVIAAALPGGLKAHTRRVFLPTDEGVASLARPSLAADARALVLREVVARPGLTRGTLARRLHEELPPEQVGRALDGLVDAGLVAVEERESHGPVARVATVRRTDLAAPPGLRGARVLGALAALDPDGAWMDQAELLAKEGPGVRDALRRLQELGLVERSEREDRSPLEQGRPPAEERAPTLTADQVQAIDRIAQDLDPPRPTVFLLHGVTGSGKTEVYLQATARVLAAGRQVLLLVPEISLTPQLTGRFRARFGEQVAVLHSGLTGVARLRQWRRIRAGEARVAVGARSALFAPFDQPGLIIVDEEHDDSYKQDEGLRYHARDLAVVRGHLAGCPVLLGTATPSAESWQNARDGRYQLLRLPERATPRPVPLIELVDQRKRPPAEVLSPELLQALDQALRVGGKAIVLYNRRGYAPVVECPGCGAHHSCPSCGVGLVYHRGRGGRLQCHYCGFHQPFRPDCEACGADFEILGHGTARVEEALVEAFPEARVGRMDADTTAVRGSHQQLLDAFREGELQILVGTQMVAKGHDFPDVHVAAVVGVDHLLMLPDFRSAERVHALVTQLAGRAGRGDVQGRVLVQTRQPEHFVFRFLVEDPTLPDAVPAAVAPPGAFPLDPKLDAFLLAETGQRRLLGYPPHSSLVLLRLEGVDRDQTLAAGRELLTALKQAGSPEPSIRIQGPVAAPLGRLVGRWRYQLVIRGAERARLRAWLRQRAGLLQRSPSGVRLTVDVDPRSLL